MDAYQAKKLSEESLARSGDAIAPYLESVYKRIKHFANKGQFSIVHPFSSHENNLAYPSQNIRDAVFNVLRKQGYKVEHLPDTDIGHRASGPYDRVSW